MVKNVGFSPAINTDHLNNDNVPNNRSGFIEISKLFLEMNLRENGIFCFIKSLILKDVGILNHTDEDWILKNRIVTRRYICIQKDRGTLCRSLLLTFCLETLHD